MNTSYNFQTPDKVVVAFFDFLNARDFAGAYNCFTPDFQERVWNTGKGEAHGLSRFTKGYFYTDLIENVTFETIEENDKTAQAHVKYTDNIHVLRYEPIEAVIESETKDLDSVTGAIKDFCNLLGELDGDAEEIKNIRLKHFFKPNAVETCLWLTDADYSRNDELFVKEPRTLQEYRRAVCENSENGWRIAGLKYS